jgi:hypothetical protein
MQRASISKRPPEKACDRQQNEKGRQRRARLRRRLREKLAAEPSGEPQQLSAHKAPTFRVVPFFYGVHQRSLFQT